MDNLIEEYGFIIVTAICVFFLLLSFNAGTTQDGYLGKAIIEYANSIIGG